MAARTGSEVTVLTVDLGLSQVSLDLVCCSVSTGLFFVISLSSESPSLTLQVYGECSGKGRSVAGGFSEAEIAARVGEQAKFCAAVQRGRDPGENPIGTGADFPTETRAKTSVIKYRRYPHFRMLENRPCVVRVRPVKSSGGWL